MSSVHGSVTHKALLQWFPKWVATPARVAKGQKVGRVEAIQTCIFSTLVFFPRFKFFQSLSSQTELFHQKSRCWHYKPTYKLSARNHPFNRYFCHEYAVWGFGHEMFTKFRFESRSKMFRNHCSNTFNLICYCSLYYRTMLCFLTLYSLWEHNKRLQQRYFFLCV